MKLTSREDIEAPIDRVHEAIMDFEHFETAALRRGAEVTRSDVNGKPQWDTRFDFRQKKRHVVLTLDRHDPPASLDFVFVSPNLEGSVTVELVALGPRRTRMNTALDLRPRTLAARLLLHSLKLARGRILKRYRRRAAQLANVIESRIDSLAAHGR